MMFLYNILFLIGFVLYLPVLLVKGKLHSGFIQRLGFLSTEIKYQLIQKPNIWVHAVSVGEVLAVVGLIDRLRAKHKDKRIVITTVTKTGYELARKKFPKEDMVLFAPLDFFWAVRQYIAAIRPEIYITAETEIWPNLLTTLARRDIPIAMVNGRISATSFYRYQRFRSLLQKVLRPVRIFCMQSSLDADRIISLGALPKNVMVAGSMKFDEVSPAETISIAKLGLGPDALVWVAGSTHPGEEKIILDVYKKLKPKFPLLDLIVAPRHIERVPEVSQLISANGFTAVCFSRIASEPVNADAVILIDTIGQLKALYSLATIVFIGKSLTGTGGQNLIEPAFYAKPVIVGPNMQNFEDITELFLESRSIIQIQGPEQLEAAVDRLLSDPQLRRALGERALKTVQKNQGATSRTEKILSSILTTTAFIKPD